MVKPFNDFLLFSFYHRLSTEFINTCPHIFHFFNIVLDIYTIYLENVNDVVCLLFLSNDGSTDIFYNNDNDTAETFISFAVMEDKTIVDKKVIII